MKEKIGIIRGLFLLFIIFAVCGWIYEVLLTLLAYGYFENRGFLFGPWLPIYGFGGLILYFTLYRLTKKQSHPVVRFAAIFLCICAVTAAVELIGSYVIGLFGVDFRTLWNYSGEPLNFEGRIGLISTLRFGVLGQLALYVIIPLWEKAVSAKKTAVMNIITALPAVLFAADLVIRLCTL